MNIAINKIKPNTGQIEGLPKNPRFIRDERFERLKKSISDLPEMLELRELIVMPQNGHFVTIGGNMRLRAALDLGLKEMPCKVLDKDTATDKLAEIAIKDNIGFGQDDFDIIANEWTDFPLTEWGMELPDYEAVTDEAQDAEPQIDKAAELNKKWKVKTGDLWLIGEHRLVCGDCTDKKDVQHVTNGQHVSVCLTDPPYGLDEIKASGKNDYEGYDDTRQNLALLAAEWLPIARDISPVVVFSPGVTNAWLYPEASWIICWFYGGGQLRSSWGFNCWQPFLCYGKDPSLATGNGGRPDAVDMNTPANAADIDHPCPKPLALWHWFINRLSFNHDEIFYEPFAGSGTTLVACQNLNRKCYAIEISENYCAVILERMQTAFPDLEIRRGS